MTTFNAYAAISAPSSLEPFSSDPGEIGPEEIEIKVSGYGLCHQELSQLTREHGLDLIVDERPTARTAARVLVSLPIEREVALPVAQVFSTGLDTQGSYRCFGINE